MDELTEQDLTPFIDEMREWAEASAVVLHELWATDNG